jgi:predicted enzyme related to lactoylglutathione lyase
LASERAMAVALDHIILPVSDAENSVRFYSKTLGFKYEPVALVKRKSDYCASAHSASARNKSALGVLDVPTGVRASILTSKG